MVREKDLKIQTFPHHSKLPMCMLKSYGPWHLSHAPDLAAKGNIGTSVLNPGAGFLRIFTIAFNRLF